MELGVMRVKGNQAGPSPRSSEVTWVSRRQPQAETHALSLIAYIRLDPEQHPYLPDPEALKSQHSTETRLIQRL